MLSVIPEIQNYVRDQAICRPLMTGFCTVGHAAENKKILYQDKEVGIPHLKHIYRDLPRLQ